MQIKIDYTRLAMKIMEAKVNKKITQEEICKKTDISRSQLSNLKYNKEFSSISIKALIKLAIVLECKIDDIIEYSEVE